MNELVVFSELHKFLCSIGPMSISIAPKSLSIGYVPRMLWGKNHRFATLNGDKRNQCLILHVDAGNPESTKGKEFQKEIQRIFGFDISEMRKFKLKKHEVYIPLEVLVSSEALRVAKEYIEWQFQRVMASRR